MKTLVDVKHKLAGATVFSKLDAKGAYWQIKLSAESSKMTCFNTPFGRYRYLRLPFGISSSQDVFIQKMDETFGNLPGVICLVDDILIYGKDLQEHDANLRRVLDRMRESGVRLNPQKCQIGVEEVKYYGSIITKYGEKPDPSKLEAIINMPSPTSKADVQTVLGMVNYLGQFQDQLSTLSAPLRALLKENVIFYWGEYEEKAFQMIKDTISRAPTLAYFDQSKSVTL